jgi:hypothetical protein
MLIAEPDRAGYTAALPSPNDDDLAFGHTIEVRAIRKDGSSFPLNFRWQRCGDWRGWR